MFTITDEHFTLYILRLEQFLLQRKDSRGTSCACMLAEPRTLANAVCDVVPFLTRGAKSWSFPLSVHDVPLATALQACFLTWRTPTK